MTQAVAWKLSPYLCRSMSWSCERQGRSERDGKKGRAVGLYASLRHCTKKEGGGYQYRYKWQFWLLFPSSGSNESRNPKSEKEFSPCDVDFRFSIFCTCSMIISVCLLHLYTCTQKLSSSFLFHNAVADDIEDEDWGRYDSKLPSYSFLNSSLPKPCK